MAHLIEYPQRTHLTLFAISKDLQYFICSQDAQIGSTKTIAHFMRLVDNFRTHFFTYRSACSKPD